MFDLDDDTGGSDRSDEQQRIDAPRFGRPVEIGRLVRALLRKKWLVLVSAVLSVVAGIVVAKTLVPRTFVAQTALVWESDSGPQPDVRVLRTLVDSVKLPNILTAVRRRLGIDATLDRLAARLDVHFEQDSNLVIVRAESDSAEGAVNLSQTVVDAFLEHQRDIARVRLQEEADARDAEVQRALSRLTEVQQQYDTFRREHGVSDLSFERQQAIELAASSRAQAEIARTDAQLAEARSAVTPHEREPTTERVVVSPELRDARRRLEMARARLSADHPRVQALTAEVQALESAPSELTPSVAQNSSNHAARNAAAARRRQEGYERLEADARERATQLSSVEGEASVLLASVRVAEGHVADVEAELARARDLVRTASPGFRIVAPPLVPEEPERSYRKPIAVGMPIGLTLLVLLIILAIELRGLKVKTAMELAYWGRAPVIASTTWPSKSRELAAVVDELAEAVERAGGQTVVLSATELDQEVAASVAEHLRVGVTVKARETAEGPAVDTTFYDPSVVDLDGDGRPIITEPPKGSGLVLAENGQVVGNVSSPRDKWGRVDPLQMPALATREEKTIARRRGQRYEQLQVSRSQVVLDEEDRGPAEIVVLEAGSGDAFARRASRAADRVIIVVRSGALSMTRVSELRALVGRYDDGVGFLLVGVPDWLAVFADRAGPVSTFWKSRKQD